MKSIRMILLLGGLIFVAANEGQAQELTATPEATELPPPLDLPLLMPEAVPETGNFFSAFNTDWPPLPYNPLATNLNVPVYSIAAAFGQSSGAPFYLIDDRAYFQAQAQAEKEELAAAMIEAAARGEKLDKFTASTPAEPHVAYRGMVPTGTDLLLDIEDATNGVVSLTIYNPDWLTNSPVWDVYGIASLSGTDWSWLARTEPGQTNLLAPMLSEAESYYRLGDTNDQDSDSLSDLFERWVSHSDPATNSSNGNGLLDSWMWANFGHVMGLAGDNTQAGDDYDGDGVSNLAEQTAGTDPNTIAFSLSADNQYVSANPVMLHARIAKGVPFQQALLLDGAGFATAVWTNYSSANLWVTLATNEGWQGVWVGLRGRDPAAHPVWDWMRFKRDTIPPVLALTSPGSPTSLPMIQLKGVSDEPLAGITYDLGSVTNERVFVLDQQYDTNIWEFTTNTFQAYDVDLTGGTNVITLRATDLAGNMTALNFTYVMAPDTNAPVLSLTWPVPDLQLGGSQFTVRGMMDDPTAKITATLNGQTNTYAGVVERDGKFWLENMPLQAGTNLVTLNAMDAWTNSMTTNFSVVRSAVTLTVDPVPGNQLWWASVNVSGTVSDPTFGVSVNGVGASVNANGNWTAYNVPFVPGNTTTFTVTAYPPGGNSTSPGAASIELNQDKGAFTYVGQAYAETINDGSASETTYNSEGTPVDSWIMSFHTDEAYNWSDFIGGHGRWNRITADDGFYNDDHVDECHAIREWPGGVWPFLPSGTQTWTGGECAIIYGGGPFYPPPYPAPPVLLEHCAVADSGTDNWDITDSNTGQRRVGSAPWTYKRHAETESRHFTGGKDLAKGSQMWMAWGGGVDLLHPSGGRTMQPEELTWGGLGGLDSESLLYAELKNGTTVDATVRAKGIPFMTYERSASPIKMTTLTVSGATLVSGSNNWAVVKATNGYVTLEAVLDGGGTNTAKQIKWSGGEEVPGFPNKRRVSKTASVHTTVTAKFGPDSFTEEVWIVWADVSVSHTNSKTVYVPATDIGNDKEFPDYVSGDLLGSVVTNVVYPNGSSVGIVARKVEIKGKLSPPGVRSVVTGSWDFYQMLSDRRWLNDTNTVTARTNAVDSVFNAATLQDRTPDTNGEIFSLDAPNGLIVSGVEALKRNSNFRVIVRWNTQIVSDPADWWVRQKVENQGTNTVVLENNSGNGTAILDQNY